MPAMMTVSAVAAVEQVGGDLREVLDAHVRLGEDSAGRAGDQRAVRVVAGRGRQGGGVELLDHAGLPRVVGAALCRAAGSERA